MPFIPALKGKSFSHGYVKPKGFVALMVDQGSRKGFDPIMLS
jgi:hypothetical protein